MKKAILFLSDVRKKIYIYLFIGDGIFDRMDNEEIMKLIWCMKKKGQNINNVHVLSGNVVDSIIYKSMAKLSTDNVSAIFIAFQNFEGAIKNNDFEYEYENKNIKCEFIGNEIDYDSKDNKDN